MILRYNKKIYYISLIILLVVFLVGLIGLNTSYINHFVVLIPYTLILSTILLLSNHREWNRYFAIFFLFTTISGFLVELIGIETGFVFGKYSYGQTLGYQVYKVPVIIGLNWFIMVYSSAMVSNIFRFGIFIKSLIGASLMVIIDYSLEPVSLSLDFWSWQYDIIPLRNYIGWFLVSFILHLFFQSLRLKKINELAIALFIIQYIFFFVLSFTL